MAFKEAYNGVPRDIGFRVVKEICGVRGFEGCMYKAYIYVYIYIDIHLQPPPDIL